MRYAIPSHRRAATLERLSGAMLLRGGVDPAAVDVWVPAGQVADYAAAVGRLGFSLRTTAEGLHNALTDIYNGYPAGTRLVVLDDDLDGLYAKVDDKTLKAVLDVPALAAEGFAKAEAVGALLWGVYPVRNALFMKRRFTIGLVFVSGGFHGIIAGGWPNVLARSKTDYETTMHAYERGGSVVRFDGICMGTKVGAGAGGMQTQDRPAMERHGVARLLARWPGLVLPKASKSPFPQVRLKRIAWTEPR